MLDLTLHRQEEESDEIEQQDWPEHRDVEKVEESHEERNDGCFN
jgi:hypothetical protein